MSTYTPNAWTVLKFRSDDYGEICKVFGGWYGGYTQGDSWKLSSGITAMEEFEDRYEFTNSSGSLYVCYKGAHKFTGYLSSVLAGFSAQINDLQCTMVKIEPKDFANQLVFVV